MSTVKDKCLSDPLIVDHPLGDVRVALCLRKVGINMGDGSGNEFYTHFFGDSPQNEPFRGACESPMSFHHLQPHQMQMLFNFQQDITKRYPGTFLTYSGILLLII